MARFITPAWPGLADVMCRLSKPQESRKWPPTDTIYVNGLCDDEQPRLVLSLQGGNHHHRQGSKPVWDGTIDSMELKGEV